MDLEREPKRSRISMTCAMAMRSRSDPPKTPEATGAWWAIALVPESNLRHRNGSRDAVTR